MHEKKVKLILASEEAAVIFKHIVPLYMSRSMKYALREGEKENGEKVWKTGKGEGVQEEGLLVV